MCYQIVKSDRITTFKGHLDRQGIGYMQANDISVFG